MQARDYIHPHGHAGDESALYSFWRRLAVLHGLGDSGQQRGLDEAEIEIGNPLCQADVRRIRRGRVRRGLTGISWTLNERVWFLASLMLGDSLCRRRGASIGDGARRYQEIDSCKYLFGEPSHVRKSVSGTTPV